MRGAEPDEEEDEPAPGGGGEAEEGRDPRRQQDPFVVVHAGDEVASSDGRLGRLLLQDEALFADDFQERLVGDEEFDAVGGGGEGGEKAVAVQ